jgi:hypothetical protein
MRDRGDIEEAAVILMFLALLAGFVLFVVGVTGGLD